MQLQFDGKKILHTAPMANLLREGECLADTIDIAGPRMYGGLDLGTLSWTVVGGFLGCEDIAVQHLTASVNDDGIAFIWTPDGAFTACSGGMELALVGESSDKSKTIVIKCDSPVLILPAGQRNKRMEG